MLNIYITEENKLVTDSHSCISSRLSDGGDLCCYVKKYMAFRNEGTFKKSILSIMTEMFKSNRDDINLLIISAHGDESGRIKPDGSDPIHLEAYSVFFKSIMPDHLIVFLNMCNGACPGPYEAFYEQSEIKPILIGPTLKMYMQDLEDFKHSLIYTLINKSDDEAAMLGLIKSFNAGIKGHYNNYDKDGKVTSAFEPAMWMCNHSGEMSLKWGVKQQGKEKEKT